MITFHFPLFSLIRGSRVSGTKASYSGELWWLEWIIQRWAETDSLCGSSVVPCCSATSPRRIHRLWLGAEGGGAAEGETSAATCCFSLFCLLLSLLLTAVATQKSADECEKQWLIFRLPDWILMCLCSSRFGCAQLESSTLPGWSNHYAHIHNHDALQPESWWRHSGKWAAASSWAHVANI